MGALMDLKVLVADDDAGMRLVLRKIVEQTDGFCIVGEAADGIEAAETAASLRPDVVFLDVEMPHLSGVEAAREISRSVPNAALIIATAHAQYMPEAFEVYAADYLINPFKVDRVRQTLNKLRQSFEKRAQDSATGKQKLLIRNHDGMILIDVGDIIFIQREDRTTVLYTTDGCYTTSESLNKLWEKLDHAVFMRSHRSYIINTSAVKMIYPYGRWTYIVKFKYGDQDALITHEKFEELQQILEG